MKIQTLTEYRNFSIYARKKHKWTTLAFCKTILLLIVFYFSEMSAPRGKDSLLEILRQMMVAHRNKYATPFKSYCNLRLDFRRN